MKSFSKSHLFLASLVLLFLLSISCTKKSTNPTLETGSLEVFSFPPSARIFLDGTDTGKLTPSILNYVPVGKHSVKLALFTYFDTTFTVDILKGQSARLEITLLRRPLPEVQLTSNPGASCNSSWSPDGSKIAFDSYRNGGWHIFSMDSKGEVYGVNQLTTTLADNHEPDWSPDSLKIAFQSGGDIWSIDSKGENFGSFQLTTNPANDLSPAWSPDNLNIAFGSNRVGQAIWVMSSSGEGYGIYPLTDGAQPSKDPDWSPDGNLIIYSRFYQNNWDLWAIDLREQSFMPFRLTRNPADDFVPSFSPDGSKIAFFSDRDGDSAIWVADSRGEDYGVVELVSGVEPFKPAWSPDWSKISFCRQDQIWVITGLR
jgi:Tol biopolymer transport system component